MFFLKEWVDLFTAISYGHTYILLSHHHLHDYLSYTPPPSIRLLILPKKIFPKLLEAIIGSLGIIDSSLLSTESRQDTARRMGNLLHQVPGWSLCSFLDSFSNLGRDIGITGPEFAFQVEIWLFCEIGRHEVVGTRQVVKVLNAEGQVGVLGGLPGGNAKRSG